MMEILKYEYNGEIKEYKENPPKTAKTDVGTVQTTKKTGRRGRLSRWAQTDQPLCRLIIEYAQAHPHAKPREIAKALNINDGKGNYVSQVLYRHRYLRRSDEPKPAQISQEERKQLLAEAINYIQGVSKASKTGETVPPPKRTIDESFQEQYNTLKNMLGRLMIYLLHNKAIDRDVIRHWIFNTVAIRNVDEYDLFMSIVFDENSWLYQTPPQQNIA